MNQVIANWFVVVLVVVLVLLALQAEPVTATLGYILAGILSLSFISSIVRKGQ